jgi:hypothetical protein
VVEGQRFPTFPNEPTFLCGGRPKDVPLGDNEK